MTQADQRWGASNSALCGKELKSFVPLPRGMNLRAAIAAEGHCQVLCFDYPETGQFCRSHGITFEELTQAVAELNADNLVKDQAISRSRPRVNNNNPYSESLFKTMKYRGYMGKRQYRSLDDTKTILSELVKKYNEEWVHSGINNVTPESRFKGYDS